MNISEVLRADPKKVSDTEKLQQIAETVAVARKAYGNEGVAIAAPEIPTAEGTVPMLHVSAATKVQLVQGEVTRIRTIALEQARTEGVVADKVMEQEIATSPILVNIHQASKFTYL